MHLPDLKILPEGSTRASGRGRSEGRRRGGRGGHPASPMGGARGPPRLTEGGGEGAIPTPPGSPAPPRRQRMTAPGEGRRGGGGVGGGGGDGARGARRAGLRLVAGLLLLLGYLPACLGSVHNNAFHWSMETGSGWQIESCSYSAVEDKWVAWMSHDPEFLTRGTAAHRSDYMVQSNLDNINARLTKSEGSVYSLSPYYNVRPVPRPPPPAPAPPALPAEAQHPFLPLLFLGGFPFLFPPVPSSVVRGRRLTWACHPLGGAATCGRGHGAWNAWGTVRVIGWLTFGRNATPPALRTTGPWARRCSRRGTGQTLVQGQTRLALWYTGGTSTRSKATKSMRWRPTAR